MLPLFNWKCHEVLVRYVQWKIVAWVWIMLQWILQNNPIGGSSTSFTSALTTESKPRVLMSKWNSHRLLRMSQASLASLKWIIKRCSGVLSQGGCHFCQLLSASCTAGPLLAPTSSQKKENSAIRQCGLPSLQRTPGCFHHAVHISHTTILKLVMRLYVTVGVGVHITHYLISFF